MAGGSPSHDMPDLRGLIFIGSCAYLQNAQLDATANNKINTCTIGSRRPSIPGRMNMPNS